MNIEDLDILNRKKTNTGKSLIEISQGQPVLLIFLRHFGCVFCREAINDIAKIRQELTQQKVKDVFVHMGSNEVAEKFFSKYDIQDPVHILDEDQELYTSFGLLRARSSQLASFKTFLRGFQAGVIQGHGAGSVIGDGFQMPGVFVLFKGEVLSRFIHQDISDRPDYLELVNKALEGM